MDKNRQLLEVITEVHSGWFQGIPPTVLFSKLLSVLLATTDSPAGFIGEVSYTVAEVPSLQIHTTSLNDEMTQSHRFNKFYEEVIAKGKVVICDFPTTLQEITTLIGLPIFHGSTLLGMVGIVNCYNVYNEEWQQFLQPLLSACAHLILSLRLRIKQQNIENTLKKQEISHRMILDHLIDAVITIDDKGIIQAVNRATQRIFGYTTVELIGQNIHLLMPEPERHQHDQHIRNYLAGAPAKIIGIGREVTGLHKDGHLIPLDLAISEIKLQEQHLFSGIVRDISTRKKTEAALQESEQTFRHIVEGLKNEHFFYVRNLQGIFTYISPSISHVLGYSRTEFLVHGMTYLTENLINQQALYYAHLLTQGQSVPAYELEIFHKDQTIHQLEIYEFPTFDHEGQVIAVKGIAHDITQRKQAEIQLKQAKEAAEAASCAKSAFLAHMSHELRTPLNSILGYTQILTNDKVLPEKQRENIKIIQHSGEHLLSLINDILDLSKIEADKLELTPKEFCLSELLEEIVDSLTLLAKQKGINLVYHQLPLLQLSIYDPVEHSPLIIYADERRLRQILLNLLTNAIKFTDNGQVDFRVTRYQEHFRFEIEDTGPGISADELNTIFLPFQRVGKKSRFVEGTGLGLPITEKLVKMMGGQLYVETLQHAGAVFWFEIKLKIIGSLTTLGHSAVVNKNFGNDVAFSQLTLPEIPEIELLLKLAKAGRVTEIIEFSENLGKNKLELSPFITEVCQLARSFKLAKLKDFLKQYIN